MLGAIITFLSVCALVAVYMTIVHRFLRAAEEPANDITRDGSSSDEFPVGEAARPPREQWAP